jgi:hypothetical protein
MEILILETGLIAASHVQGVLVPNQTDAKDQELLEVFRVWCCDRISQEFAELRFIFNGTNPPPIGPKKRVICTLILEMAGSSKVCASS